MKENRENVIHIHDYYTKIGYISYKDGKLIYHSFDDEPALIFNIGTKYWYKDGLLHRDNNLPAIIHTDDDYKYYKNDKRYWFINEEEYYDIYEVKEKFKNNILTLKYIHQELLKENGIVDALWLTWYEYLILDQSQYNLAVLKFL